MQVVTHVDIDEAALREEFNPAKGSRLGKLLDAREPAQAEWDRAEQVYQEMHARLLKTGELARSTTAEIEDIAYARTLLEPLREADGRALSQARLAKNAFYENESELMHQIPFLRRRLEELNELTAKKQADKESERSWGPGTYKTIEMGNRAQQIDRLSGHIQRWLGG